MKGENTLSIITSFFVPIVSVFASFIIGLLTNRIGAKREANKQIYFYFYAPVMKEIVQLLPSKSYIDSLQVITPIKSYRKISELIALNIHLASPAVIECYRKFELALIMLKGPSDNNKTSERIKANESYNQLIVATLEETNILAKKLKYPETPKEILKTYFRQI
ncbi:hypothetical protein [Fructobacillus cardui]|uniref:hypothetical protein n=1 Tax=Fructobacillus cardui TaxID=2893170 RepID=UPI00200ACA03|nr:hypothetical protein [Fructobacillus cardui]MCK8626699.1 hypothetical protein [Fructobacillus cardui]